MYTLEEFRNEAINLDFQRTNLFSVVFATIPSSKTQELLNNMGGFIFNNVPVGNDFLGITQGDITQGITNVVVAGTEQLVRKSGVSKFLIGAMTNRVIQSLLGEFEVGTYLLDFFNMAFPTSGLMAYSVKMPENRLSYEMDRNHNAPNIKLLSREFDPLIVSFRMDSESSNYRAMQDWVNAVEDPVTGLRALPVDVECDVQVNLHTRSGLPHTVAIFRGAIPVAVSAPELSYEDNNTIATFDVTFAYRSMHVGAVGRQAAIDWLESKAIGSIENISEDNNLSSSQKALSRLGGPRTGIGSITRII
ncbi:tail assembly protein [Providencia phage PSTCR6]|nr:tail assembly protein [Providencia phage PSTCR6]